MRQIPVLVDRASAKFFQWPAEPAEPLELKLPQLLLGDCKLARFGQQMHETTMVGATSPRPSHFFYFVSATVPETHSPRARIAGKIGR
jgi:hypothetical protein